MSNTEIKKVSEDTFETILSRIVQLEETGLKFPPNFSPENAARSAWLMLQETQTKDKKPVLEACSKVSIANALLKMVSLGLNPVKKQCYFIAYGDKLELSISYQGTIATAKRHGLKSCPANLIYDGDDFQYKINSNGTIEVTEHKQSFKSLSGKIIGVYAVTNMEDGTRDTTIMTMDDVRKAWMQGATNGNSPAHKNFEGEMAKKTVINRACKTIINSSDDAELYNETREDSPTEAHVKQQIAENANKTSLGFDEEEQEAEEVVENEERPKAEPVSEGMPQMNFGG